MRKYAADTHIWRMAVVGYYEISIGERRRYRRAHYGYQAPRGDISPSPNPIPFVEWLSGDASSVRRGICADRPDELRHFTPNIRPSPEMKLFFYALSEVEAGTIAKLFRTPQIKGRNISDSYPPPRREGGGPHWRAMGEAGSMEEMVGIEESGRWKRGGKWGGGKRGERGKRGKRGKCLVTPGIS